MGLRRYLMKRAINTAILILFVVVLNFAIFQLLPGEAATISLIVENPHIPADRKQYLIALEEIRIGIRCSPPEANFTACPIWTRFEKYFVQIITFQFGDSFQTGQPVVHDIVSSGRLENTLLLLGLSSVVAIVLGVFLGVMAARRRGGAVDTGVVSAALATYSLPTFWMGLVLIFIFAFTLGWFPTGGAIPSTWADPRLAPSSILGYFAGRLQHLFLPALTLTLFFYGGFLLLTRATMVETLSEDYITTARAKGLPERTVLYKHALKNASLPLVTAVALQFGFLLSGAIITETVFNYDGLGKWLFDAIGTKDGPVMQAMFYLIALCVIMGNFASDIIYGVIDPRIKYE